MVRCRLHPGLSYFSLANAKGKTTDARPLAHTPTCYHNTQQLSLAVMAVLPRKISKRCAVAGLERWCACLLWLPAGCQVLTLVVRRHC